MLFFFFAPNFFYWLKSYRMDIYDSTRSILNSTRHDFVEAVNPIDGVADWQDDDDDDDGDSIHSSIQASVFNH